MWVSPAVVESAEDFLFFVRTFFAIGHLSVALQSKLKLGVDNAEHSKTARFRAYDPRSLNPPIDGRALFRKRFEQ